MVNPFTPEPRETCQVLETMKRIIILVQLLMSPVLTLKKSHRSTLFVAQELFPGMLKWKPFNQKYRQTRA